MQSLKTRQDNLNIPILYFGFWGALDWKTPFKSLEINGFLPIPDPSFNCMNKRGQCTACDVNCTVGVQQVGEIVQFAFQHQTWSIFLCVHRTIFESSLVADCEIPCVL